MRCPHSSPARQRGAALVVAMLVFALCAALIVAMKSEFTRFYQRGANLFLSEQAHAYLRGAEDLAGIALLADYDIDQGREQPRDDLDEIWAQPTTPYALDEGGWLAGKLTDLQGRFNINALAARTGGDGGEGGSGESGEGGEGGEGGERRQTPRFTAAQAQFIRLLQALGEPNVSQQDAVLITESIADFLDPDSTPSLDGAEDDYYFGLSPAYRAANRPMTSVSELRAVAYMTPEIFAALENAVTVWPLNPGKLNIHTAPALVLRSLNADDDLSPLSESDGEALVAARDDGGFEDVEAFLQHPVFEERRERMEQTRGLLGEASSVFLLEAEVEVADRNMRLYSVLERRQRSVAALARAGASL